MFKTCKYCHRIVNENHRCGMKPKYQKHNKTITKFRNSKEWKNKAIDIKERDNYLCRLCFSNNIYNYKRLSVHHIVSLEECFELKLEDSNLITLCRECHELAEKRNSKERQATKANPPYHIIQEK